MLIQYAYLKQRLKFGKQCIFEQTDPIIETNIQPEPKFMRKYITRPYCNRAVQSCKQFALHKVKKPNCKSVDDINSCSNIFLIRREDIRVAK